LKSRDQLTETGAKLGIEGAGLRSFRHGGILVDLEHQADRAGAQERKQKVGPDLDLRRE